MAKEAFSSATGVPLCQMAPMFPFLSGLFLLGPAFQSLPKPLNTEGLSSSESSPPHRRQLSQSGCCDGVRVGELGWA